MLPAGGLYVVTAAPPAVRVPADLETIAGAADVIELRLDLLASEDAGFDVGAWIAAAPRPVLATLRSRSQGGQFTGTPAEAAERLEAAAAAGAAWIDVEGRVAPHLGELPAGTRRVASEHGAAPLDEDPWVPAGFDFVKLARPIDGAQAYSTLLGEAAQLPAGAFVVPYGRLATTRTLFVGPERPGFLFGSAREDAAAAPGQPPLTALLEEQRAGEVSPRAALYGLVGDPPGRSPSPALHNAVFRARNLDALYVPLPGFSLREALGLPVEGLSVTQPYKTQAFELADVLDPIARAVGAVNTLVRRAEGWWGGNTDATGIHAVLPTAAPDARAFVYGAGGYARAAVWALRERGYVVRLGARHDLRGEIAASACGVAYGGTRHERLPGDAVVVNATPAGADGASLEAFDAGALAGLVVLDAPYRDAAEATGFVQQAEQDGAAQVVDGRALLAAQACDQARAFGAGEDVDVVGAMALALTPPPTLILLGTRGAGKTSVGRVVARRRGRPFVDLDEEIERVSGRPPAAWIEAEGWAAFRRIESTVLERVLQRHGIVLATGGGVVEDPSNRASLAAHGICVHLAVSAAEAARRVARSSVRRPRIEGAVDVDDEARLLLERRTPLYTELAKHTLDANNALDAVVAGVLAQWPEQQPAS